MKKENLKDTSTPSVDQKTKKKTKRKFTTSKWIATFLSFLSLAFLAGVVIVAVFVTGTIATAKPITTESFEQSDSTIVLDANDNVIYDLGLKLIENVEYDEISQSLIDAFVSIEDSRFFEHNGFDVPRFTSAMFKNVVASIQSLSLSFDGGGASTIDMQLARNVLEMEENVVTGEVEMPASSGLDGVRRKIREIYYATKINSESILDKKTIFQKYVNQINFGTGYNMLGVQKAANYYFDKDVSSLNTLESAFLAGVINSPSNYTPYNSLTLAKERTHEVLYYMNYHGYIDDFEYERAISVPLENIFVQQSHTAEDAMPNQSYIDVVLDEVEELTGLDPATTPMIIKTAMNPELQSVLDRAQNREIDYLNIGTVNDSQVQLAATVLDNATGEIIGIFGGYDYYGQRIFNRSYHGLYQPGSTAKPFLAYAPAFEFLGYATSHTFVDEPYYWAGTNTLVTNWNNRYSGEVTLQQAISNSYNTTAVKTLEAVQARIGHSRYVDYVESIGFVRYAQKVDEYYEAIGETDREGRDSLTEQFAIGGQDFYTNTQELAGATAMIMNGGDYIKPHTIREVTIVNTNQVIESPYKATPVLSDGAAYLTAKAMRDVIDDNRYVNVEKYVARNYPVYAKTGTSDWSSADAEYYGVPSGSAKDRLLLTATNRFSMASWTGFDAEDVNKRDGSTYIKSAEHSFQLQGRLNGYILDILEEQYGPGKALERPSSVKEITHILGTYPYQSPIADMNPDLITTGLVKAEAATLVSATPPELETLKSATVTLGSDRKLDITFTAYPDAEKLIKAPDTLEMQTLDGRKYTGKRLYDPSWIFGPVRYQTDILLNGEIIETIQSETEKQTYTLNGTQVGKLEVCSYYTFELNQNTTSNKICNTVDMSEVEIMVPRFSTLDELRTFAGTYAITLNTQYKVQNRLNLFNTITEIDPNHQNRSIKIKEIQNKTWNVFLGDYQINTASYINTNANTFVSTFSDYLVIEVNGNMNQRITSITNASGNPISSIILSTYNGEKIVVNTNN